MPTESAARASPCPAAPLRLPAEWRCLYIVVAAALVGLLFWLGEKPWAGSLFSAPWDKLAHLASYFTLAVLLCLGGWPDWAVIAGTGLIGGLDELHQVGLPARSADISDFAADVIAAVLAVAVLRLRHHWLGSKED